MYIHKVFFLTNFCFKSSDHEDELWICPGSASLCVSKHHLSCTNKVQPNLGTVPKVQRPQHKERYCSEKSKDPALRGSGNSGMIRVVQRVWMGLLTPPPFAMNFLLLVRLNFAAMVPGLGDRGKNLKCLSDFPLLEKGPDLRMTKNSRKSVGLENFTAWRGAPAFFLFHPPPCRSSMVVSLLVCYTLCMISPLVSRIFCL